MKNTETLLAQFLGFDQLFNQTFGSSLKTDNLNSYPPYNIIRVTENEYVVEVAIAGVPINDINITIHDGALIVEHKNIPIPDRIKDYPIVIHQGIAKRNFKLKFPVSPEMICDGAEAQNGILSIKLHREIPEEKLPKKIDITVLS